MKPPFRMSNHRLDHLRQAAGFLCLFAVGAARLDAGPIKFIAVSANAVPTYVRPVDAQGKPRPESYIFTEGKLFGGKTADPRLSQTKFNDIIKNLAPSLAKQNYFPAKEVSAANILIMVHWGTTTIYEDPQAEFSADRTNAALNEYLATAAGNGGNADPGALNAALGEQTHARNSAQSAIARNSALLGFKPNLEKEQHKLFPSADEQTMNAELNEERYFVILMAYDYQRMKTEHQSRLLWTTRISVRSPGNNFTEAMPALVAAGADVYGRKVDGMVRVNGRMRDGRVELGELKILGQVEDPKPDERKK